MSDIHALSGAYAVDALDDDEREQFEQHLAVCPECRAEVRSFSRDRGADRRDRGRDAATEPARLRAVGHRLDPPAAARDSRAGPETAPTTRPRPRRRGDGRCAGVRSRCWSRPSVALILLAVGIARVAPLAATAREHGPRRPDPERAGCRQRHRARSPGGGELTIVRSPSLERAVMIGKDVPAPEAGQDLPALAPAAGRGHGVGRPDAGRRGADRAHRRRRDRQGRRGLASSPRRARRTRPPTRSPSSRCRSPPGDRVDMSRPRRIAVIGSGVAGLTAAHVAAKHAHVTLYEADARLGGHADTHDVATGRASPSTPASSSTTSAPTRRCCASSPRSASRPSRRRCRCRCATRRPAWSTPARSALRGLFPTGRNLRRPGVPADAGRGAALPPAGPRAARAAGRDLRRPDRCATSSPTAASRRTSAGTSWSRSSPRSWSCDPEVALDYPARYLFEFLAHHGMLSVTGSPQWRTVVGGSREYVARVAAGLDDVRVGTKVTSVRETADARRGDRRQRRHHGVRRGRHRHPPRPGARHARRSRPPPSARRWPRSPTPTTSPCCTPTPPLLPRAESARASWNFLRPRGRPRRGDRHLRPDPAPAAAHRDPLPGHPRRRGPRRPAHR